MIVRILVGMVLLFVGRRLFWFLVGFVGFVAGLSFGPQLFEGQPGWVLLLVAVVAGVLGALLALVLQRFAVGLAGFLIGGYLLAALAESLGLLANTSLSWIAYIIGGILGSLLTALLFEWALILLSALAGATLIVQSVQLTGIVQALLFLALLLIGVLVQAGTSPRVAAPPPPPAETG